MAMLAALIPRAALAVEVIKEDTIPDAVKSGPTVNDLLANIVNILLYVAAAASVITIIVGGIIMVTSSGNPDRIKTARDAILYAVIGLVIALSAFAIVTYVLSNL